MTKPYPTVEAGARVRQILIVEDSQLMNSYYRRILGDLPGCELIIARDGLEAYRHVEAKGAPDIIILDINLPVMNGLEFLRVYRENRALPNTPVIIVSTEGNQADRQRGLDAGASAYLTKPFDAEALRLLILRHLASQG